MKRSLLALALGLASVTAPTFAENWPQWRGPNLNGSANEANLPEKLDESTLAWFADLPGRGASTPIIWDEKVFVSSQGTDGKLSAHCFERKSGKPLWTKEIALGSTVKNLADLASPSAATDGKVVIFYFGSGDLAAFDLDGKELWKRNIQKDHGPFYYQWIYGSTGLLHNGKLIIPVLQRDKPAGRGEAGGATKPMESYLVALDPATGEQMWKVNRPDEATMESKESYCTPIPWQRPDGKTELLIVGGDVVTGHDFDTGKELWRAGDWNPKKEMWWRLVPSVVVAGDLAIACAPKGGPVMAYKLGADVGNGTAARMAWSTKSFTSDVAVPLYYQGNLYVLEGEKKALTCVDPKTGEVKWSQKINSRPVFRASPTGADGKVYCMNEAGDIYVFSATEPKILSESSLKSQNKSHATISAAGGMLYVRTGDKLYCFGKK